MRNKNYTLPLVQLIQFFVNEFLYAELSIIFSRLEILSIIRVNFIRQKVRAV